MRVAVKLLLILVLVFAGVKIWYGRLEEQLRLPVAAGKTTQKAPEVVRKEIARQPIDYAIIAERNIFQAVVTKAEQKETQPSTELEATKLKLSLMGTISGAERDSRAIIADDLKKQQDIYQVGDSIQGALIKSIERGRVVLSVNGSDEELLLKDREGGGPAYEPSAGEMYQEPEAPAESPPEVVEPVEQPVEQAAPLENPQPQLMPGGESAAPPEAVPPAAPVLRARPHRLQLRMPNQIGNEQSGAGK